MENQDLRKIKKWKYFPIVIFDVYIMVTLLLYFFGPVKYLNTNNLFVLLFMFVFLLLANFAYFMSVRIIRLYVSASKSGMLKLAKFSIMYSLVLFTGVFIENAIIYGFDISSISNIFRLMAVSYTYNEYFFSYTYWIYTYTSVIYLIAMTLGMAYFDLLSRNLRIMYWLIAIIVSLNNAFFVGSQKAIIDLIIYIISGWIIYLFRVKTKKVILVWKGALIVLITIMFLGVTLAYRRLYWNESFSASLYPITNNFTTIDMHNFLLIDGADGFNIAIIQLSSYFSQGYYGLQLALRLPFEWTGFLGSSFTIRSDIARWFDLNPIMLGLTYPERVSQSFGYAAFSNWHTIFPWLASDFTFIGSIFVVVTVIYVYGKTFIESISQSHWTSILLFSQLNILLLFIPANNQLFQTRQSIIATMILLILWLFHKRKIYSHYFHVSMIEKGGNSNV